MEIVSKTIAKPPPSPTQTSKLSTLEQLPDELLLIICRHLDVLSIKNICLTSHELRRVALPEAFRHGIKIDGYWSHLDQAVEFFTTKHPEILDKVQSISFFLKKNNGKSESIFTSSSRGLDELLYRMPCLQQLEMGPLDSWGEDIRRFPPAGSLQLPKVTKLILGDFAGCMIDLCPNVETIIFVSKAFSEVRIRDLDGYSWDSPIWMLDAAGKAPCWKRFVCKQRLREKNLREIHSQMPHITSLGCESIGRRDLGSLRLFLHLEELALWDHECYFEAKTYNTIFRKCLMLKRIWVGSRIGMNGQFIEVVRSADGGVQDMVKGFEYVHTRPSHWLVEVHRGESMSRSPGRSRHALAVLENLARSRTTGSYYFGSL